MKDEELADLALEAMQLDRKQKRAATRVKKLKDRVLGEVSRRGIKGIDIRGVRITFVQAERVVYNGEFLRSKLRKSQWAKVSRLVINEGALRELIAAGEIDRRLVARFTRREFDESRLAEAVATGAISAEDVEEAAEIVQSAPYVRLSEAKDAD